MANEFLSQDEIDALLAGVTGETPTQPEPTPPSDGPRPYDLARQERIVRGRMPTLEIIHERFARNLRVGLFNFMRRSPEVSVGPVKVIKYGQFLRDLVVPTNLNLVQMPPLRGSGLFIFEPRLVFAVVDMLFGGDGRFEVRIEGRDFTATEMRIIQRLLAVAFEEYEKAWKPVYGLRFEYVRSEMNPQFAAIATPAEIVVATTFTLEFGNAGGDLHLCIPYATLEPIRDVLYSTTRADHSETDGRWLRMLSRQVQLADVELSVPFVRLELPLRRVVQLRAGDILPVEPPQTGTATVDGVPLFECRFGTLNGRHAIRIEKILGSAREDVHPGETHVAA